MLLPNLCSNLDEIRCKISAYLFSICEFCDSQHMEGLTFLVDIRGIAFMQVP